VSKTEAESPDKCAMIVKQYFQLYCLHGDVHEALAFYLSFQEKNKEF